jgi:hypothetical protein
VAIAIAPEVQETQTDSTAIAVIAAAEAVVAAPPTTEELLAKKEAVFAYTRNHKIVPQVYSKRTSSRLLCAGCAFGIRQETEPKYMGGFPYHPNCLKAATDHAFAMKLSPRYLAAAVPVMTELAHAKYAEDAASADASDEAEEPAAIEDLTEDVVQEATKKSKRSKSA